MYLPSRCSDYSHFRSHGADQIINEITVVVAVRELHIESDRVTESIDVVCKGSWVAVIVPYWSGCHCI